MVDKKKDEEEENVLTGVIPSILSMGAGLAGLIPSLLKGPQEKALRRQQEQGAAGAALARQTASDAAGRVVGASTAQPSSGRGGAVREGLRSAERITAEGGRQAAVIGAQESANATRQLRQNTLARRQAALTGGAGLGEGLATVAAALAAARDQGTPLTGIDTPQEAAQREATFGAAAGRAPIADTQTGASLDRERPGGPTTPSAMRDDMQAGQEGLDRLSAARQQALPAGPPMQDQGAVGQALTQPQFSPAQQSAARLATSTVEKQNAVQARRKALDAGAPTTSTSPTPPPFTDPARLEPWIYQQVNNYNPRLGLGMSPEAGLYLLQKFEIQPDFAALGMADPMMSLGATSGP